MKQYQTFYSQPHQSGKNDSSSMFSYWRLPREEHQDLALLKHEARLALSDVKIYKYGTYGVNTFVLGAH